MSLWGKVGKWLWGIDVDAEAERSKRLDEQIAQQNARAYTEGKWDLETYQAAEARREAMKVNPNYDPNLWPDFWAGAQEGAAQMADTAAGAVRGTLNTAAGWFGRAIPWWVWLAGLIYLAWWMGWLKRLRLSS
jgi:hypothetical protein